MTTSVTGTDLKYLTAISAYLDTQADVRMISIEVPEEGFEYKVLINKTVGFKVDPRELYVLTVEVNVVTMDVKILRGEKVMK